MHSAIRQVLKNEHGEMCSVDYKGRLIPFEHGSCAICLQPGVRVPSLRSIRCFRHRATKRAT